MCVFISTNAHTEHTNNGIDYAALNMRAFTGNITDEDVLALNMRVLHDTTGQGSNFASRIPHLTPIAVYTMMK